MAVLSGVVDPLRNPRVIPRAVRRGRALPTPVLWLDASEGNFSNFGQAGNTLDAQNGSTGGTDTNDVQVLPHGGTNYLYLPGVTGNFAWTPHSTALDITGDIDVRVRVALDNWGAPSGMVFVGKGYGYSWYWYLDSTVLGIGVTLSGGNVFPSVSWSSRPANGAPIWLRVTRVASTGVTTWFSAPDEPGVPASWTTIGTHTGTTGNIVSSTTSPLGIGAATQSGPLGFDVASGKFYRAQILSGVNGTVVFDANFTALTSGAATSFTESSSNTATVTINRAAGNVRKSVVVTQPAWMLGADDYAQVADHPLLNIAAGAEFSLYAVTRFFDTIDSSSPMIRKGATAAYDLRFAGGLPQRGTALTVFDGTNSVSGFAAGNNRTPGVLSLAHAARQGTVVRTGHNGTFVQDTSIATVTGALSNADPLRIGHTSTANYEMYGAALFRRALSDAEQQALAAYYGNTNWAY